jgi:hypothetical protein
MPYVIVKENDQYCVYKQGTGGKPEGKALGKHPDEAGAKQQLKALYANMKREGKTLLENIKALMTAAFGGSDDDEDEKNESTIDAEDKEDTTKNPKDKLKEKPKEEAKSIDFSFGFKILSNKRWSAAWSNNFRDKQGEIFSKKSIQDFIDRAYKGETEFPELWWKHIPAPLGQTEWMAMIDHIAVAGGAFNDAPYTQKFVENFNKKDIPEDSMSHGYIYYKKDRVVGVYDRFNSFELTTGLTPQQAANDFTDFVIIGENEMKLTEKQLADIKAEFGEASDAYLAAVEKRSKELEEKGIDFKANPEADLSGIVGQVKELASIVKDFIEKNVPEKLQKAEEKATTEAKSLSDRLDGIVEFLKFQFQTKELATESKKTIVPDGDPTLETLKKGHEQAKEDAQKGKKEQDVIFTLFPMLDTDKE